MSNLLATRRQFLIQASAAPALFSQRPGAGRPNILLIAAEGVGSWMLGCYGNPEFQTPNIDRLARAGVRFTSAYACAPSAPPSLAGLLSGRTGQPTSLISDTLAAQGYHCGFTGYWPSGGSDSPQHKFVFWSPAPVRANQAGATTTQVNRFLDDQRPDRPFFLAASYASLNAPYDGYAQKHLGLYAASKFEATGWEKPSPVAAAGKEFLNEPAAGLRKYAAGLSELDAEVGAVIGKLAARGLRDNTVIVFAGTCGNPLGRHGLWGDGAASDPVNMYDEVVRVPLLWNWPGRTPTEASRPELISLLDVAPALADAAGSNAEFPGRSFVPLATGRPLPKKQPWRNLVFAHSQNVAMVRDNRYKLVSRNAGKGPNELFDLRGDTREKVNQYANPQFVTVRDALARALANHTNG